jgi:hypothetical protein
VLEYIRRNVADTTDLRKLKVFQLQALHDSITKHIGSGKKPTTTAALLIGYRTSFEVQGMTEDMLVVNLRRTGYEGGTDVRMKENCPC